MELLTVAGITTFIVFLFTLAFQYLPGLREKWAAVDSTYKKLIVLALYLVSGAVAAFGGCIPELKEVFPALGCVDAPTFLNYVFGVVVAVGAGQGVFSLLPELDEVRQIRLAR